MSRESCRTPRSGRKAALTPQPAGAEGLAGSPNTVTREKEFHFSYSGRGSARPLTHWSRTSGDSSRTSTVWTAAKTPRITATATDTSRSRRLARRPKSTAESPASAPTAMTAVGPSVTLSVAMTSRHPIAAPMRSHAYSLPTRWGNFVSASATQIPLKTNGTAMTAYVSAVEMSPPIVMSPSKGTKSEITKLATAVAAKRTAPRARCSATRSWVKNAGRR